MMIDRRGTTLDGGRITLVEPLDRVWRATVRDGGSAIVGFRDNLRPSADLDELFRYDVPGIAKLEYLGHADGVAAPTARDLRDNRLPELVLAEARPLGETIANSPALDERQTILLGIDLCTATLAWADAREFLTPGIRPETVYALDGRFTGATPRIEAFLGRDYDHFAAPSTSGGLSYLADDVGFVIARLLWFAHLREDPYRFPGAMNDDTNIWEDRRRPWTGSTVLGQVLSQVLVADDRLPVAAFRTELEALL